MKTKEYTIWLRTRIEDEEGTIVMETDEPLLIDTKPTEIEAEKSVFNADKSDWVIREVIDLLSATRHSFKSKQIEKARHLLEGLLQ